MPIQKSVIDQALRSPIGERAYKIVATLTDAGFDAWWVGGGVRDMLQEKMPTDIDIATSAKPDEVRKLFTRATDEGDRFGSARILLGHDMFEVTTFREDDEASDGRHPESVVFGTREQDAKRRDFTVNAIYFHPISREIYDPYDGEGDLKERLIRFIGEPGIRIKHDALRILRAVRFRARLEGQYEPETYAALRENASMIEVLSGPRILEELEKILANAHPDRALEDLWELGVMSLILPELYVCKGVAQPADYHKEGDVWDHLMQCIRSFEPEDTADVRLAALFHDCGKAKTFSRKERIRFDHHATVSAELTSEVLRRLGASKKRIEKIDWLVRHHMGMTFLDMPEERKGHWYFHPYFAEILRIFRLDIAGTTPSGYDLYDKIVTDYHRFLDAHPAPAKPLLSGDEVMKLLGIGSGAKVGQVLKTLNEAQSRKEITTKGEAKEFMRKLIQP